MSVDIVFICDRCGCSDHVRGSEPLRPLSQYIPEGWNGYRFDIEPDTVWFCEVCSQVVDRGS